MHVPLLCRQDYRISRIYRIFELTVFSLELKAGSAEVDQKTDVYARGFEITYQLRLMYRKKIRNCFQFNDKTLFYH